jgi:hypothetical protein
VALLHQFIPASQALLKHIKEQGTTANYPGGLIDLQETNAILGAGEMLAAGDKY